MKPVIGVMPLYDKEKSEVWMLPEYLNAIEKAGGEPLVFPYTDDKEILKEYDKKTDGYLFTGGNDVNPKLYDEENRYAKDVLDIRDAMEAYIYELSKEEDKPLLGICRGLQIINVLEGGTLYQDLEEEHPGLKHRQEKPYSDPHHEVILLYESPLHKLFGTEKISVNSLHHQAVRDLSWNLKIMAFSTDDLIEAVYDKKRKFMWAVQWHPEYMPEDVNSKLLFSKFVEMAGAYHNEHSVK